jgi:predicted nucleic acid-binding protein
VVPAISLYEVFKRIHQQRGEDAALRAIAVMLQGRIADLDTTLALNAAKISIDLKIPMADSIILATARAYGATLWAQDAHFKDIGFFRNSRGSPHIWGYFNLYCDARSRRHPSQLQGLHP